MKYRTIIPMLSLQLFAEGAGGTGAGAGDGGTAQGSGVTEAAAGLQKGVKGNPLANVKYGIQEDSAPAAEVQTESAAKQDRNAMFEQMIKGEYKDLYDARVQDTVQKRLKGHKEIVDKYHALEPVLEILGRKHGVDASDITALVNAIEADDTYYEDEAMEKGLTVQQLKKFNQLENGFNRLERENTDLRAQIEESQRQEQGKKLYAAWAQQAEDTKKMYPSFDLRAEMNDPRFTDLLKSNIDVRTAYEVLHKDEIIPAAMQYTAQTVESKLAKKIASNGARPAENGMASQSAALVKSDVSQLTKEDRAEIIRRVQRGEIIRF